MIVHFWVQNKIPLFIFKIQIPYDLILQCIYFKFKVKTIFSKVFVKSIKNKKKDSRDVDFSY